MSAQSPPPGDEPDRCIVCRALVTNCECTGGPQLEHECTCYEGPGHQPGCYYHAAARERH